jgi:ATP-dependent exoDNAse (exonuclease V) alpha subunit
MNIFNHFQHLKLSTCQETALEKLESFFDNNNQVFILKGYAGTGKTTILKGVVEYLNSKKKSFTLMAPTGRAAKVLRDKTTFGKTIHSSIYDFENLIAVNKESEDEAEHSFHYLFPIKKNGDETKIIIVDESSMISSIE